MSTWQANRLTVIAVWAIGLIGPVVNGDTATVLVWSLFAVGVGSTITLLERLEGLLHTISSTYLPHSSPLQR